jgi:hypothetical protein
MPYLMRRSVRIPMRNFYPVIAAICAFHQAYLIVRAPRRPRAVVVIFANEQLIMRRVIQESARQNIDIRDLIFIRPIDVP